MPVIVDRFFWGILLNRSMDRPSVKKTDKKLRINWLQNIKHVYTQKKLDDDKKKTNKNFRRAHTHTYCPTHTHPFTHIHTHYSYSITASAAPSCMNHVRPLNGLRGPRMHMLTARATAIDTRPVMKPMTSL